MAFAVRFRIATEKEKIESVARLVKASTGDFDFYLFAVLGVTMASLGLALDSPEVIIGSMLIAPVLYPFLSLALALVLSDLTLAYRSVRTLFTSIITSIGLSFLLAFVLSLFVGVDTNGQILARAEPSVLYFIIAFVSGIAATYSLVHANLNETLPGVAISVSLVPPLAAVGVALALLNTSIAIGALVLFLVNAVGILLASMVTFTLMDVHSTHKVVSSAISQEEKRLADEQQQIKEIVHEAAEHKNHG